MLRKYTKDSCENETIYLDLCKAHAIEQSGCGFDVIFGSGKNAKHTEIIAVQKIIDADIMNICDPVAEVYRALIACSYDKHKTDMEWIPVYNNTYLSLFDRKERGECNVYVFDVTEKENNEQVRKMILRIFSSKDKKLLFFKKWIVPEINQAENFAGTIHDFVFGWLDGVHMTLEAEKEKGDAE